MAFNQSVHSCGCGRFGAVGCHAVKCVTDGGVTVWISHAPEDSHPACRLDDTSGVVAQDQRTGAKDGATIAGEPMCGACKAIFGV